MHFFLNSSSLNGLLCLAILFVTIRQAWVEASWVNLLLTNKFYCLASFLFSSLFLVYRSTADKLCFVAYWRLKLYSLNTATIWQRYNHTVLISTFVQIYFSIHSSLYAVIILSILRFLGNYRAKKKLNIKSNFCKILKFK